MNQAIDATIAPAVTVEIVTPLLPLIAQEHPGSLKNTLQTYRALGDASIDAVFPINDDDQRVGKLTGRNREGVIRDSITSQRGRIALRAATMTHHTAQLQTLEARTRRAERAAARQS